MRLNQMHVGSGEIREGLGFWKGGLKGQWGTKGDSLQATWDRGGHSYHNWRVPSK